MRFREGVDIGVDEGFAGFLGEGDGAGAFSPGADDREVHGFEQGWPL